MKRLEKVLNTLTKEQLDTYYTDYLGIDSRINESKEDIVKWITYSLTADRYYNWNWSATTMNDIKEDLGEWVFPNMFKIN